MIWCVYVACVLRPRSRQSQEPKWWMKRGFCLIIGIINFSIPSAQPGQQITVCCPTTDTHQQLSSDGIYSREIWKVNNVLQLLNLLGLLNFYPCFWETLNWIELNQYVTDMVFNYCTFPDLSWTSQKWMDYHGLSWTVMDCHGLLWTVMDCHGLSWTVMDCHGLS